MATDQGIKALAVLGNTLMQMPHARSIPESWKKRARQNKQGTAHLGTLADN